MGGLADPLVVVVVVVVVLEGRSARALLGCDHAGRIAALLSVAAAESSTACRKAAPRASGWRAVLKSPESRHAAAHSHASSACARGTVTSTSALAAGAASSASVSAFTATRDMVRTTASPPEVAIPWPAGVAVLGSFPFGSGFQKPLEFVVGTDVVGDTVQPGNLITETGTCSQCSSRCTPGSTSGVGSGRWVAPNSPGYLHRCIVERGGWRIVSAARRKNDHQSSCAPPPNQTQRHHSGERQEWAGREGVPAKSQHSRSATYLVERQTSVSDSIEG